MTPAHPQTVRRLGLALAALSFVYLGAELVFNVMLLDVTSVARATPEEAEHAQYFGRIASGFGFALLVLGIFQPTGFYITTKRGWRIFIALAAICVLPFILSYCQILFGLFSNSGGGEDLLYLKGLFWGLIPFIGIGMVWLSRGHRPALAAAGLVVMAWPAMFYGQVMAVERLLIAPTTVEERRDANYILILKSGIEDCVVALRGQKLCDAVAGATPENHAVRAVMGAMFMLNPQSVFESLGAERERIIGGIAASNVLFPVEEYYGKYVARVSAEREKALAAAHDRYYAPYRRASNAWLEMADPQKRAQTAAAAADRVEAASAEAARRYAAAVAAIETALETARKNNLAAQDAAEKAIDDGWAKYQKAVLSYRTGFYATVRDAAAYAGPAMSDAVRDCGSGEVCIERLRSEYHAFCRANPCGGFEIDDVIASQRKFAEQSFQDTVGYPSTVPDRAAFLKEKKTQNLLREQVEKGLRDATGDKGFRLPKDWTYGKDSFGPYLDKIMRDAMHTRVEHDMQTLIGAPGFHLPQGWTYERASFRALTWPLIENKLNAEIERQAQKALGDPLFRLGAGWTYRRDEFIATLEARMEQGLQDGWDKKSRAVFGKPVPPGLEEYDFYAALGLGSVPKLQDLLMPLPDFVDTYIVPLSNKAADQALAKIKADAPDYANGRPLSTRGKDFVRALYIPAIALCISLTIVVLTLCKNLTLGAAVLVDRHVALTTGQRRALKPVLMSFFMLVALMLPYLRENAPVSGPAYQAYRRIAAAEAPVMAAALDWIVRVQPVVYRVGKLLTR